MNNFEYSPKNSAPLNTPLEEAWARTLDKLGIKWVYEPEGLTEGSSKKSHMPFAGFHLPTMNGFLEICPQLPFPVTGKRPGPPESFRRPFVIQGSEYGLFRFRDVFVHDQLDLILFCTECDSFFFSFSLTTPCGYCGTQDPWVHEQGQVNGFGVPGGSVKPRNQRRVIEQELAELATKSRQDPVTSDAMKSDLFDDRAAEKGQSREETSWESLKLHLSGPAYVHQWPAVEKIQHLKALYPNFAEVCQYIINEISLSKHRPTQAVQLANLLLVGSPSCGKSSFSQKLAEILVESDHTRIDLGQATTNFALVGSDSGFKNAKEGRILRLMAGTLWTKPVRNPVVILDEIDKAFRGTTYDPLPALLSLLEKQDARRFVDEYFVVPVDASGLNFVALANTLTGITPPLLSRFQVFHIPDYTRQQFMDVVIPAIYHDWCTKFFPDTFPRNLSADTRRLIAEVAQDIPRRVPTVLSQLVFDGHDELTPSPTWELIRKCNQIREQESSN